MEYDNQILDYQRLFDLVSIADTSLVITAVTYRAQGPESVEGILSVVICAVLEVCVGMRDVLSIEGVEVSNEVCI